MRRGPAWQSVLRLWPSGRRVKAWNRAMVSLGLDREDPAPPAEQPDAYPAFAGRYAGRAVRVEGEVLDPSGGRTTIEVALSEVARGHTLHLEPGGPKAPSDRATTPGRRGDASLQPLVTALFDATTIDALQALPSFRSLEVDEGRLALAFGLTRDTIVLDRSLALATQLARRVDAALQGPGPADDDYGARPVPPW